MVGTREPRRAGETLTLGGILYCIEEVEGQGGSVIVYRASYQDSLNRENRHEVLIKELYPYREDGGIYRDEDGNVCAAPEAEHFMERHRKSFRLGNQANLSLLLKKPERISGNLNSYEAYGTYFSVLTVHGGKSLQKLLDEGEEFRTLRSVAVCIRNILDAAECFHENGILHLDICPDNVLMLSDYALLIDYNSALPMERERGEEYFYSEKEGYTAPEVRLLKEREIGKAADLYSACAIFFRMLTGRPLSDLDRLGRGVGKCFPKNLKILKDAPMPAAYKAVEIIRKGLHELAGRRYQTAGEMREDLDELIRRIDGFGVSHGTLWEGSFREFHAQKTAEDHYLERAVRMESGEVLSEEACFKKLLFGKTVLLKGAGGMGKTRLLMRLWEMGIRDYRESLPVTVYIPLMRAQDGGEDPDFIKNFILRRFCRLKKEDSPEEARRTLDGLRLVLLLDGLNEAGTKREALLRELERLGERENIGILVTDRTDSVKKYALRGFAVAKLLPLAKEAVLRDLEQSGIPAPAQEEYAKLLTNPMMLFLYRGIFQMETENGAGGEARMLMDDMDAMTARYLDALYKRELRKFSGSEESQLLRGYLICHLLPEIAGAMKRKKKVFLTFEELYGLTEKNYRMMQGRDFAMAFPEYMGKTRRLLAEVRDEREWFDFAVSKELAERLNLLEEQDGSFLLLHENFISYLAGQAEENRKRRNRAGRKTKRKKAAVLFAAALLMVFFLAVWRDRKAPLSKEEQGIVYSAAQRIGINVGICNRQIQGQDDILKAASTQGVLEGKEEDKSKLLEVIEKTREEGERNFLSYRDGADHLKNLEDLGKEIPLDMAEALLQKPEEFQAVTEHVTELLKERLCGDDSVYNTYDRRKALVDAYREYVDAYKALCGAQYSQMAYSLGEIGAERAAEELTGAASEMLAVGNYVGENSQTGISDALTKAKRHLSHAVNEMERQGF